MSDAQPRFVSEAQRNVVSEAQRRIVSEAQRRIVSEAQRRFAMDVVRRLHEAGYTALWAGGCVRDSLRGETPKDYDVATDARPDTVRQLFAPRTRAVGASFGVILVHGPKEAGDVEVATFRSEGPYLDGRRPDHVVFCTPEEDAQRRDFTINGMFFDPLKNEVLDFVGGQEDLQRKVVRAIGDPHARFREDKLRLLRAIRFGATLAFQLEPVTASAVREMAGEILIVSAERITMELKRMLVHPNRTRALELARESRLLAEILPELRPLLPEESQTAGAWENLLRTLDELVEPDFELVMAVALMDVPGLTAERLLTFCRRFRLSNNEADRIVWLVLNRHALDKAGQLPLSKLKRTLAHEYGRDLLALNRAEASARQLDLTPVEFCEDFLRRTPASEINPEPLATGDDLIAHGLRPGRQFKDWLEQIRDAQLEGRIHSKAEALQLADQLHKANRNDK